jgi:hypothetical protein
MGKEISDPENFRELRTRFDIPRMDEETNSP